MPEEQTQETQLLQAFIDSSLPGLSPETALQVYAAARQYRYLREELERQATIITQALQSDDPGALVSLLSKVLRDITIDLQQLPQLQSEPDEKKTQREIEIHASHIEKAQHQAKEVLTGKDQSLREKQAEFAHELTVNFIRQSRRVLDKEEQERLAALLQGTIEERLTTVASAADIQRAVETVFTTTPEVSDLVSPIIISQVLQASQPQFIQELQASARIRDVVLAAQTRVLEQSDISNPDLFLSLAAEEAASSTDAPDNIVEKAAALTRVAGVLSQTISTEEGVSRPVVFFRAMAKTPLQKALAPIADAALNLGVVPQETREAIMQEVFHRSWEKIARDTDGLNARFGKGFVDSTFFQQIKSDGNTMFAPSGRTPTQGIVGGLVNIGLDVGGAVFGSPKEMLTSYIDLARRGTPIFSGASGVPPVSFYEVIVRSRPTFYHFYLAQAYGYLPQRFHLEFLSDLGNWILRLGTKKAGAAAMGGLAKTAIGKRISGALIGRFLGGAIGAIAGPVGAFIGSVIGSAIVGKVWGVLSSGIKGIASLFTGGLVARLMYGSGKLDGKKDWVIIFLILLFGVLMALVGPFSAFNPSLAEDEDRMTSLAVSLSGDQGFFDPNYVHPGGTLLPENIATGSCPIYGGVITTGSYNPVADIGHGSSRYWGSRVPSYSIPTGLMTDSPCVNRSCPYYGFAIDVVSRSESYPTVAVPSVCPIEANDCGGLTWTVTNFWYNCAGRGVRSPTLCQGARWGWGAILTTAGNGHSWKIYINHIDPRVPLGVGQTFNTTTNNVIGTTTRALAGDSHVHIELNMDGLPALPDFLCR